MKTAALVLVNLIRLLFVALLALGFQFWSGQSSSLVPLHMRLGEVLVTLLWILAVISVSAGVCKAMVLGVAFYGVVVVAFGMRMAGLVAGSNANLFGVLHLLVGLGAVGLAEMLGGRIKRGTAVRS